MIEEVEQGDAEYADNEVEPITPSPTQGSSIDETAGHERTKTSERERKDELNGADESSVFVGDKLL